MYTNQSNLNNSETNTITRLRRINENCFRPNQRLLYKKYYQKKTVYC